MLDTTYYVETPEGIDLRAQAAGPVPRILAYAIDLFYRTLILIALAIGLSFADEAGTGVWLVCAFLLEWFYPVFFEVLRNGQTPGKKAFGLMVINSNLTPATWGSSLLRNLLRFADFLPFFYASGIISMTMSRQFQRLGDIAAGTMVVYQPQKNRNMHLPNVAPKAPPRGLQLEDQRAIISLTERHNDLSEARQGELADLLQPVTGKSGQSAVQHLRAIGRWLLGG